MMTPEQALEIVGNVVTQVRVNSQEQDVLRTAMQTLRETCQRAAAINDTSISPEKFIKLCDEGKEKSG